MDDVRSPVLRCGIACVALVGAACRTPEAPLPEVEGGVEVGLRCYNRWDHFTVKPPHIMGPEHNLKLAGGRMRGAIAGKLTDVRIEKETFTGMIAGRAVEVWMGQVPGEIAAEGTWYGASVRLSATDDHVRASVPTERGSCCHEFNMVRSGSAAPGWVVYEDARSDFEYRRLELPSVLRGWYSTPELTLLIIALLFTSC
jgi:hypothetical protein